MQWVMGHGVFSVVSMVHNAAIQACARQLAGFKPYCYRNRLQKQTTLRNSSLKGAHYRTSLQGACWKKSMSGLRYLHPSATILCAFSVIVSLSQSSFGTVFL
eukprot:1156326-Pelagomonas_calceolata.AAC.6